MTFYLEGDEEVSEVQLEGVEVRVRRQQARHKPGHLRLGEVGERREKKVPHKVHHVLPVALPFFFRSTGHDERTHTGGTGRDVRGEWRERVAVGKTAEAWLEVINICTQD